jgi:multidrug efflux pump subunit AcrA (membrane-fusion protein)
VKKRKVILIVIIIIVALTGWQVYRKVFRSGKGFSDQNRAMPVAVEITAVQKATIRDYGNFTGTLVPKSQFIIAPKISGRLERLMVNIGDRITRDQLIAELDDEEYSQQVIQAEADLKVAQANLEESLSSLNVAKRELERIEELHKRGISADSELDSAKGQFAAQDAK